MPMKICSLRPDSKMCCSHLGRRARERWWQVSPPSLSRDLCLGVRREGATDPQGSACSAPPSRGGGADSWTQNKTLQTGCWGLGAAQSWALSDLGLLPDVLLGLQGFQKLFQACLDPCVLWALKNQNTNLFFFPLDNNFLSCHAWILLESFVGCCRRGTGSMFCEGSRVWLFCSSYVMRNGWSFFLSSPGHA